MTDQHVPDHDAHSDQLRDEPVDQPSAASGEMIGEQKTKVSKRWLRKMLIFFVVCIGLGIWGLYDAAVAYPNRGELYSQFTLEDYLKGASDIGEISIPSRVNVPDPATEILRLEGRGDQLNALEILRLRWLSSLRPIHGKSLQRLTDENTAMQMLPEEQRTDTTTVFQNPSQVYANLTAELQGRSMPKPLSQTDIAVQWLICAAGMIGAGLILLRIIQTRSTVYRYHPEEHRLVIPGGKSITPDQIEVVDKSKWHKFFVALELKGGDSHKFDLLRFEPLEDWILDMEASDDRLRALRDEAQREEEAERAAAEVPDNDLDEAIADAEDEDEPTRS
jgi:hypothetical protein